MTLTGHGVTLERLTPETAELVRVWRNSPRILQQMEYREIITPEMQQRWFHTVQNDRYRYFIIRVGGEPVGMIHLADINPETKDADAGLFVGEEPFAGTGVALGASLLILEYAFDRLGMQRIHAKVKSGNEPAEKYNTMLGFKKEEEYNTGFNKWILSKDEFERVKPQLLRLLF